MGFAFYEPATETSWWLDWAALPERLLWARLQVSSAGNARVFDLDGNYHSFPDRESATLWLNEEEYSRYETMLEYGELDAAVCPPQAATDAQLISLMNVDRRS